MRRGHAQCVRKLSSGWVQNSSPQIKTNEPREAFRGPEQ